MKPLPEYDPTEWRFARRGDSRQVRWSKELNQYCPKYQEFWRNHIVPLTFRPHEEENYFVRPTQKECLLGLVDASYATFFHFAGCLEWCSEDPTKERKETHWPAERLYCFFCHLGSLIDAALDLCVAVNRVLDAYSEPECFRISTTERGHPKELKPSGPLAEFAREFNEFARVSRTYRNAFIHRRPVYVHGDLIPKLKFLKALAGLTAISNLARNEKKIRPLMEEMSARLEDFLEQSGSVLNEIWKISDEALSSINDPKYRDDQLRRRPEDEGLTLEKILKARE